MFSSFQACGKLYRGSICLGLQGHKGGRRASPQMGRRFTLPCFRGRHYARNPPQAIGLVANGTSPVSLARRTATAKASYSPGIKVVGVNDRAFRRGCEIQLSLGSTPALSSPPPLSVFFCIRLPWRKYRLKRQKYRGTTELFRKRANDQAPSRESLNAS